MKLQKIRLYNSLKVIIELIKHPIILDRFVLFSNPETYLVREGKRITGFFCIKKLKDTYELGCVFLYKEYRGRGLGKKMLRALKFKNPLYLMSPECLVEFYRKAGFSKVKKKDSPAIMGKRIDLSNKILKPMFGYQLVLMKRKSI